MSGIKLEGDVGEIISLEEQTSPCLKLKESFKCIQHTYKDGPERGVKRGCGLPNNVQPKQLKQLVKVDRVEFIDGENEKEGNVVLVDRFTRTIGIEVDDQYIRIPVHSLRPEGATEPLQQQKQKPRRKKRVSNKTRVEKQRE